jgi:hypothetical protein
LAREAAHQPGGIVKLIAATRTERGFKVMARPYTHSYRQGIKDGKANLEDVKFRPDPPRQCFRG